MCGRERVVYHRVVSRRFAWPGAGSLMHIRSSDHLKRCLTVPFSAIYVHRRKVLSEFIAGRFTRIFFYRVMTHKRQRLSESEIDRVNLPMAEDVLPRDRFAF